MAGAIARRESSAPALAERLGITPEKLDLIRAQVAPNAPDDVLELYFERCRLAGADPFSRMFYAVSRNVRNGEKWETRWNIETTIDGFRSIAESTGEYDGQDEPVFTYDDRGNIVSCKVTVYRKGMSRGVTAVAYWDEYVQLTRDGKPGPMWAKMPHGQLAKCFDPETEILTSKGFERFDSVRGVVLQVSERGLEPVAEARPFCQRYTGPMVAYESDDLNFCVTPNHDMITTVGKMEASALYAVARGGSKDTVSIPRSVLGSTDGDPLLSDARLTLCAAYLADGYVRNGRPVIAVSRPRKIAALRALGLHTSEGIIHSAGKVAVGSSGRAIRSNFDKILFEYDADLVAPFISDMARKEVRVAVLTRLSRAQARVFTDALVQFDGSANKKTGVRRFFASNDYIIQAFEVAAVAAGYAISPRSLRLSDISSKPNVMITISDRDAIPVMRWGRKNPLAAVIAKGPSIDVVENTAGQVWCVTVPSGKIVVRRRGFSMICGNCTESLALRKAFPRQLSGLYTNDEMAQSDNPQRAGAQRIARGHAAAAEPQPSAAITPAHEPAEPVTEAQFTEPEPADDLTSDQRTYLDGLAARLLPVEVATILGTATRGRATAVSHLKFADAKEAAKALLRAVKERENEVPL